MILREREALGVRAAGKHEPREPVGQCRLADTLRTAEQYRVRQPVGLPRREQPGFRVRMAEEIEALARMRRAEQTVALYRVGDQLAALGADCPPSGFSSRSTTASQMRVATASRACEASITTQRFGSLRARSRNASRS